MQTATDRLEMRLPPEEKQLLGRAAEIEGVKLRQFVLGPALRRARRVVAEAEAEAEAQAERVSVSARGYRGVLEALAHPPAPTPALVAALKDYEAAGIQWR